MSNREVIEIIKDVNSMVDRLAVVSEESDEYADLVDALGMALDLITIDCPRWKYYNAWELKMSKKTGHYWVVFA